MKETFGRLTKAPHPELHRLLYAPAFARDARDVLPLLLRINAAHVVMLERCGIIARKSAAALLRANAEIAAAPPEAPHSHRGLYALFEHELTARAGDEAGGSAHVARSRNDINATVARLRVRQLLLEVADDLLSLQSSMLDRASRHARSVMPGFTHFQPAQPTTLGHYLAGVSAELDRAADRLLFIDERLDRSPMGACAGFGTSFAVRPELVAAFLGFSAPVASSLDAVASRDYVADFLAACALIGMTLTRLASDLQQWASNAYRFVGWGDDFVSTSSIMPQKRNAFVLESIRGKAATAAGEWVAAVMGMKSTPFTNGIEVSADVVERAGPAAGDTRIALQLMTLLIEKMEVHAEVMERAAREGDISATALADVLVRKYGIPFRAAHDAIAKMLSSGASLEDTLGVFIDPADVALDPRVVVESAVAGGGPASASLGSQLDALRNSAAGHRRRIGERSAKERTAAQLLRTEIDRILAEAE